MIVVDASVSLKWVYDEAGSVAARALLDRREVMIAPDLWTLEVGNGIGRRFRSGLIDGEQAKAQFAAITQTGRVGLRPLPPLQDDAFDLALELSHPIYDCTYLALARREGVTMITADRQFAERASSRGWADRIELIGSDHP